MMKVRVRAALIVLASAILSEPAQAKGMTIQLTITGPGLEAPLHSSENSLTSANVWFGNYIDWDSGSIDSAVSESSDYRIHFWVQIPRGRVHMKYIIWYRWDDDSKRGIICLPGQRDPWYSVNVFSITHGNEGSCFYAEDEWGKAVKSVILDGE